MKQYICIILLNEKLDSGLESITRENDRYLITIIQLNPAKYTGAYFRRYHTIYCDSQLSQTKYRDIVNKVITPLASLNGGKGLIWI